MGPPNSDDRDLVGWLPVGGTRQVGGCHDTSDVLPPPSLPRSPGPAGGVEGTDLRVVRDPRETGGRTRRGGHLSVYDRCRPPGPEGPCVKTDVVPT